MEFLPEVPGFSGEDPASPKLKEAVWIDSSPTESFPTPEPDSCSRYWAKVAEEEQKRDDRLAQERLAALNLCLMEVDEKNGFTLPAGTGTNMCDDVESDGVSATVHDDSDDEGHEFDEQKVDHPKNVLVIALSCRFMFLALRHACMVLYVCFCFGLQHVYGHVVLIQGSWPST